MYRDRLDIGFEPLEVSMDCNGVYNELQHLTNLEVEDEIEVQSTKLDSYLMDRNWIGSHQFRLRSFNGDY